MNVLDASGNTLEVGRPRRGDARFRASRRLRASLSCSFLQVAWRCSWRFEAWLARYSRWSSICLATLRMTNSCFTCSRARWLRATISSCCLSRADRAISRIMAFMLLISLTMRPKSLSAAWPSRGEPRLRPILHGLWRLPWMSCLPVQPTQCARAEVRLARELAALRAARSSNRRGRANSRGFAHTAQRQK